jgi:hypothetical protein
MDNREAFHLYAGRILLGMFQSFPVKWQFNAAQLVELYGPKETSRRNDQLKIADGAIAWLDHAGLIKESRDNTGKVHNAMLSPIGYRAMTSEPGLALQAAGSDPAVGPADLAALGARVIAWMIDYKHGVAT